MSKRKRPARTARSRINAPRPTGTATRTTAPATHTQGSGKGLWLYGLHAVTAALQNPARKKHRLIATKQAAESLKDTAGNDFSGIMEAEIVDRSDIDAVCGPDSVHQGLALLASPLADLYIEDVICDAAQTTDTLVVLDQATDPRNIGAVLRSARAFGVRAVILQDRNAPPETGAMAKAASGALEYVSLVRVTNLARAMWALKDAGYWCLGLDGSAESDIGTVDPTAKRVVVLGAEGTGLRRLTRETCDQLVRIPMDEAAESLNLSNAAAIALYVVTRNR
ncbi:MAG: 23S rRNA (guanosine(2251)-2'-O)-methyltransferase RlmB [Rhodospirillales bacterium]